MANKNVCFHPCMKDIAADNDWALFLEGIVFCRPVREREIKQRAIVVTSRMDIMENAITIR